MRSTAFGQLSKRKKRSCLPPGSPRRGADLFGRRSSGSRGKGTNRVYVRVEYPKDEHNSSYSSLQSDWQTINSNDENMRSFSMASKEGNANKSIEKRNDFGNSPVKEENSKDEELSKNDQPPQIGES